jgi:5-methylthioadenosine/S-adenosylhomocysteine deaminase
MSETTMVYGKHLIIDAKTAIADGAVVYIDDRIQAVGTYEDMRKEYNPARALGSSDMLVAPGFINAHGHGRGLTDFQLGSTDDVLEAWKYRTYPGLDMYYDTLLRSLQMLESGITTTMHNHNLQNPHNHLEEFNTIIDAYENAGIRAAFAPTLIDDNIVLYGDRDVFMANVPTDIQNTVLAIEKRTKAFDLTSYLQAMDDLIKTRRTDSTTIIHGPLAPQWCRTESLQAIRDHAHTHDLRVHIHILQTVLQKEFSRRYRTGTLVDDLADIGLLGPNTTCGHAIWLSEEDILTLAATQTSVTTHSSCNLRIQSGLSPVRSLLEAGIKIGIGMDDKTIDDRKDFFAEMRLTARLHRLGAYEMLNEPLSTADCYRMATVWGAELLGFPACGTLTPGSKADIILMDYAGMTSPYTYPDHSPQDVLLYRGNPGQVHTVIVNGKIMMQNRIHAHIDREEVEKKLIESLSTYYPENFRTANKKYPQLKQALADFYRTHGWYEEENTGKRPYYFIHNKD